MSAVFPVASGAGEAASSMAAFAVRDGRAHRTPVTVGARNSAQAWVREGLAPGDSVVVYPPTSLVDGARVRIRSTTAPTAPRAAPAASGV